jgi:hypothetical protein
VSGTCAVAAVQVSDTAGNRLVQIDMQSGASSDQATVHWSGLWSRSTAVPYRIVVTAPDGSVLERDVQVP